MRFDFLVKEEEQHGEVFIFQTEQLLNPCTINVVEPTEVAKAGDTNSEDGVKNDETEDMDVDADADAKSDETKVDTEPSVGISSAEVVRGILDDVISDATRPTQEQFFDAIVADMVRHLVCKKDHTIHFDMFRV